MVWRVTRHERGSSMFYSRE